MDEEPAPLGMSPDSQTKFGYGMYSARYGNIYTCRQLLQLAQEAFDGKPDPDIVWRQKERFSDALRPNVEPDGLASAEETLALRANHLKKVRILFRRMDVFVYTFGLTEAWTHKSTGKVYPTCPGTLSGEFDPTIHELKNFTHSEVYADFCVFRKLIKRANPQVKFLLTVSPVPLTATAEEQHVLLATTYSKSVLRAVAGELERTFEDVDYFPSYELIASPGSRGFFYEPNLRSVNPAGVATVMQMFFAAHGITTPAATESAKATKKEDVVCEEAMLEEFGS
jgi:hypothetical protein